MRIQLYRAVAERTLAHAASAWSRDITQKQIATLDSIQRPFLLNITGAYRTAPTAALQIIAGIMPLHLKLKMGTKLLQPTNYEKKAVGWQHHPSVSLEEDRIQIQEEGDEMGLTIYTDGSKMETGVGTAFYANMDGGSRSHIWYAKLHDQNSVFQAELLGIVKAIQFAKAQNTPALILSDSQSSLKAIKNMRTSSPIARGIQDQLIENETIRLGWIKAHAGRIGNKMADMLAKEATTSPQAEKIFTPVSRSSLMRELREWATQEWQKEWDRAVGGRTTHKIHPKENIKTNKLATRSHTVYNWTRPIPKLPKKIPPSSQQILHMWINRNPPSLCHSVPSF
ncbi:hypothetical protein AVEN_264396-1 [Araneus ventricosus]|uniref:ribonuclease H n=1 Tax=Araneus ventricosus TaxID=182803 RepID=A0A4Y2H8J7_ARAVE|nr:hypothetical protein AVEN_264396-1 [Araneus ventricosus]